MSGDHEGHGSGTVVLAFLAGAVVGAVAALLLAPRPGTETRRRLVGAAGTAGEGALRARDAARAAGAAAAKVLEDAMRGSAQPPLP